MLKKSLITIIMYYNYTIRHIIFRINENKNLFIIVYNYMHRCNIIKEWEIFAKNNNNMYFTLGLRQMKFGIFKYHF